MPNLDFSEATALQITDKEVTALQAGPYILWTKSEEPVGDPSLISMYHFDETGNQFLDSSGNGHHITFSGDRRTTSISKDGTGAAKYGAVLAGGDSGVDVEIYNSASSRTFSFWASRYLMQGTWVLRMQAKTSDSGAFGIYFQDNTLKARVRRGDVNFNAEFAGVNPVLENWYHVAMTYDSISGDLKLYLSGVLRAAINIPGGGKPDDAIGMDVSSDGIQPGEMPGSWAVDILGIWSRALTPAEIQAQAAV